VAVLAGRWMRQLAPGLGGAKAAFCGRVGCTACTPYVTRGDSAWRIRLGLSRRLAQPVPSSTASTVCMGACRAQATQKPGVSLAGVSAAL
jgi:hypothetical protein